MNRLRCALAALVTCVAGCGADPGDAGPGDAGLLDAGFDAGPAFDAGFPHPDAGFDGGYDAWSACAAGTADCDMNGSCETNTTNDPNNCAFCGGSCAIDGSCVASVCRCPAGSADYGERCRDVASDPTFCGLTRCRPAEYCTGGTCTCRPGLESILGFCADLQTDPMNCGSVGHDCSMVGTMVTCRDGACQDSCLAGQTNCSNACVQLDRDPLHCGTCMTACAVDQVCASSSCQSYRPAFGPCPTACTGSFGTCCAYGGNTICVSGASCPATSP